MLYLPYIVLMVDQVDTVAAGQLLSSSPLSSLFSLLPEEAMAKAGACCKFLFYTFSVFLNLFLLYLLFSSSLLDGPAHGALTWTKRPALEAEEVAAVTCSGHGRAFLDGFRNDGKPVCECYGCYKGADCSDFRPDGCTVHVDSGDPLFLERFWMQNKRMGGVVMSGWHRMGYQMIGEDMFSAELEKNLRLLHATIGNANATGKHIVFGVGAMQLLIASVYALSAGSSATGSAAKVVSHVPYYPAYRLQTHSFNGRDFEWGGDTTQWENNSDNSTKFVEFVTSPNNPDGHLREPKLTGPNTQVVHDRVYYWPHFTAIPAPADDDMMIFSLGKVTGHAGSRFGWALVKDEAVYKRLKDQVEMNVIGISHDTQLRALMLVKSILGKGGRDLFEFGHTTLRHKWERLNEVVSQSKRFSLQKISPQYCTYFRTMRQPSPGYAWIKCEREEETDCQEVLQAAGVFGNKGNFFGADRRYARLSLTKSQEDFELMLERIKGLVAEEEGAHNSPPDGALTWTKRPALEAEEVASVSCSGHGRAFLDGLRKDGKPVCECYGCYKGDDCSEFQPEGCSIHVDSGDPLFLERFWMQNKRMGGVMMSGWHRMGYYMIGEDMISAELERHLRLLHAAVGNANATGKYIVFGVGAMQLLISSIYALSAGSESPAKVVSNVPYYGAYRYQTTGFNGRDFEWGGDTAQWENNSDNSTKFVEFVTSPNNPDGHLREPKLRGPNTQLIHDRVYYWPHFTALQAPADDDVMIFSLGKVTGHAGSRFGWALVKDEAVYQRLRYQVELNVIGISHDTQLRALNIVKSMLGKGGSDLFEFGYTTLRHKWERLNEVVSQSKRFSLQKIPPLYCTYLRTVRQPSPGYAWIRCEREEETDCQEVLQAAGVIGNKGSLFGADIRYARLSLTKSQEDFELMLERIKGLIAEEGGALSI
ncbi:hypothetical protein H6P81_001361 [Aristolochia fimbriata]|uniref:Uncharacterized protein n=1 Tax=Aristolochia fimbriata TaxID=158543 RepID=A0AAV7F799_ARIFI|nr:hypothetical protein H6P81_001361 [Aristolochia fimbriata]